MSNSKYISYTKISPHKKLRTNKIDTITIHCMAGNLSLQVCANVFQGVSKASSNYGIDTLGNVGLFVPENYRSMCSSNTKNDDRAITIEVANDGGANTGWHISDAAMNSLILLVADICIRNGIKKLVWSANKTERINHKNGCNMTVHRDFANKACPGDYLYSKMKYIANSVNNIVSDHPYMYNGVDYELVFNPVFYSQKYPDVRTAYGSNRAQLFEHFIKYGMSEKRQGSENFNVVAYISYNADLRDTFKSNWKDYYKHYIEFGKKENRRCL